MMTFSCELSELLKEIVLVIKDPHFFRLVSCQIPGFEIHNSKKVSVGFSSCAF